ncbi:MAG TPA: polysaccharide deacetylase family protein [Clostridia bacterium]|nr:polysaccharide deacetylase family protein [Clostridia bacterium]
MPLVKKGDTGPEVREIQRMLSESGLRVTVDGKFGDRTEAAIKLFQKRNGLISDGVVGPKTKAALQRETKKRASSDLSSGSPSSAGKGGTFYVVKKNETLSEISRKVGVPTTLLSKINGIQNPNFVREGQKLKIPEGSMPDKTPNAAGSKGAADVQPPTSEINNLRSLEVGRIYTPEQLKGMLEALAPVAGSLSISRGSPVPGSRSDDSKKLKQGLRVALTFDDGPFSVTTPVILDTLKQNGSSATFFIVGSMAVQHPDLVRRIISEGHILGNHSYSHSALRGLSPKDLYNEVRRANAIIQNLTGSSPKFFRPPYGDFGKNVIDVAASHDLTAVAWSNVAFNDYPPPEDPEEFIRGLTASLTDGYTIMLHDGLWSTVNLLPKLMKSLKNAGVKIVPLSEVLDATS